MADWATVDLDDDITNTLNNHSQQRSLSSGQSDNKENKAFNQGSSHAASNNSNKKEHTLAKVTELKDGRKTETLPYSMKKRSLEYPSLSPQNPGSETVKSLHTISSTDSVPTENITIPNDANISSFTCDQLVTFFKCLKVDDRIISHLHRKSVDGKRFSKLKDSELDSLGINNPVVVFFRNKSKMKGKGKEPFML